MRIAQVLASHAHRLLLFDHQHVCFTERQLRCEVGADHGTGTHREEYGQAVKTRSANPHVDAALDGAFRAASCIPVCTFVLLGMSFASFAYDMITTNFQKVGNQRVLLYLHTAGIHVWATM